MKLFSFKKPASRFTPEPYDPATQEPMIRSSICTGEKVAGFRDKHSGHFTEIMLIRSEKDVEEFKRTYGVDTLRTEY